MAAVIIPRDQLRIPEHLRGRLERPALRVVAPPRDRSTAAVSLRAPVNPLRAPVNPLRAPDRPAPVAGRVVRSERGGVARLVVVACVAVVALTGFTALVAGHPAEAPPSVVAPSAVASPMQAGDVWVVQPGDSLWSIAAAVAPGADLRPIVDELARRAGGGGLQPGQRIATGGIAA